MSTVPSAFNEPTPSTVESSPAVQEMHSSQQPNGVTTLEMQRQLLKAKLAQQPVGYTSPTDQMMTPVSRKLADHKKKTFSKAKPSSLSNRFKALGADKKGPLPPRAAAASSSLGASSLGVFGEPAQQQQKQQ